MIYGIYVQRLGRSELFKLSQKDEQKLNMIIIIAAIALLAAVIIVTLVFFYLALMTFAEPLDCSRIVYSTNWTLQQLRNISAICSNGG